MDNTNTAAASSSASDGLGTISFEVGTRVFGQVRHRNTLIKVTGSRDSQTRSFSASNIAAGIVITGTADARFDPANPKAFPFGRVEILDATTGESITSGAMWLNPGKAFGLTESRKSELTATW